MSDLITALVLLLGAFAHGLLGFGFPLISTPSLLFLMEFPQVILLTLLPTVAINLLSIAGEKHWREALQRFWPIPLFTIAGSLVGTKILLSVDPQPLRLLLALVLIIYLLSDRFSKAKRERNVPRPVMGLFGFGLGLLGGMINIFAPAIVMYALFTRMNTVLMVATFNLSFLVSKSGQILGFVLNDAFDWQIVRVSLWLLPFILLFLWLGMRLRKKLHTQTYMKLLRFSLWIIALVLMVDSVKNI